MSGDPTETVFLVDDEESVRRSLKYLLESVKIHVESFDSAESFLKHLPANARGCIVLDVRMPGMGGPELMNHLQNRGVELPIVFLTAHGDVPLAVRAMQGGAIDFLQKPPNSQTFLESVRRALIRDRDRILDQDEHESTRKCLESLSERERQVLDLMMAGNNNKQIAWELGISHKTVETHRSKMMRKMRSPSYPELIKRMLSRNPQVKTPAP